MWLREPVLILTISVAVLGLLFAIRRILAEATVVTSSDGAASDTGASPWHCRDHCPTAPDLPGLPRACSRSGGPGSEPDDDLVSSCPVCFGRGVLQRRTSH